MPADDVGRTPTNKRTQVVVPNKTSVQMLCGSDYSARQKACAVGVVLRSIGPPPRTRPPSAIRHWAARPIPIISILPRNNARCPPMDDTRYFHISMSQISNRTR
ncbi:Hypothetical protein NTJ_02858 [Nesidiocoris tenuis]|uniref:Uncharacterized protein n=1 Tax=Nesidiocoris tenuis TaxID=355587 RepID=A0ABN7ACM5_9HEMI|nr:Hypothetical protein NTJ_02858 [Nesidiocoris tenuis]